MMPIKSFVSGEEPVAGDKSIHDPSQIIDPNDIKFSVDGSRKSRSRKHDSEEDG